MLTQQTVETLRRMRLDGMAEAFLAQMESPATSGLSFEERFGLLVDCEMTYRQNRRLKRLLKEAHLKMAACLEDIDWQKPRGLDRSIVMNLSSCQWVLAHQSVLISGPTGVGKTYLCCALANQACRYGYSARYYRAPRLFSDIAIARGDGSYHKLMNHLAKTDLLVIDDWGLAALNMNETRDLLEVMEDRCETRSTVIASQLPIEDWHHAMPDPTAADAILDRLVHTAHKIVLRGESMRKYKATSVATSPKEDAK